MNESRHLPRRWRIATTLRLQASCPKRRSSWDELPYADERLSRAGLDVLHVEDLTSHYALTLDCWAERFDARWEAIRALDPKRFDERFRRIWRTYLWSCAEMFRSPAGYTHLFQIVFSKGNITRSSYPMGRGHLYAA